ncbi:hypothetical protein BN2476_830061 [Paraburkholderia piptadeniae]|uniref:Uncharacterized protein n=1 Tax=Paraburkholderia piptadeniae TaxID=1701573 RepID=A0A1N7ST32_9BURK|nr:hypothetical protein BN2476_830061 [Paraburkholderia piptadeniae]
MRNMTPPRFQLGRNGLRGFFVPGMSEFLGNQFVEAREKLDKRGIGRERADPSGKWCHSRNQSPFVVVVRHQVPLLGCEHDKVGVLDFGRERQIDAEPSHNNTLDALFDFAIIGEKLLQWSGNVTDECLRGVVHQPRERHARRNNLAHEDRMLSDRVKAACVARESAHIRQRVCDVPDAELGFLGAKEIEVSTARHEDVGSNRRGLSCVHIHSVT